ncbi:alpha-D-ribose 1-methylphosphonate 5-triphosphate diphosphatase [Thermodesulfobacterium sp. TA1]|uniref:alpha-D-ribose 1-methylphosphonate 5-triphosphate diphosphatase n=1 Tax=Thermodesulfobacterium sp. TA1 TaxID=2234087 RepID=UPI001232CF16|nr:alpha-D-ribose 1-methylphosphonate 5-triphosphate diphosphatase [Thermodesulfobacterium sp. TA1]QER41866.1 alpha-D-ribose 1-methylphosphonate 5-triphosphate diphosphatase [Thermodesulfobacterium sp. TA1]
MSEFLIEGSKVITPFGVLDQGYVLVSEGKILEVGEGEPKYSVKRIKAKGMFLLPGLIDLHSDAIEKEVEPRPNTFFPFELAILELDRKLALWGITTFFHAISFADKELGLRSNQLASKLAETILKLKPRLLTNHKIHARLELTNVKGIDYLGELIEKRAIDALSIMDHTPGQGQFKKEKDYKEYLEKTYKIKSEDVSLLIKEKLSLRDSVIEKVERFLIRCREKGLTLISHDDDSAEKVRWVYERGITVSEFPTSIEAAKTAKELGMTVCVGSPNALRGLSHHGNLSARELIKLGYANILCSDYTPSTLIQAIFKLSTEDILPLHEAIKLATLNPAKAVNLDKKGSIEEGKDADLILVKMEESFARVVMTMREGRVIYSDRIFDV